MSHFLSEDSRRLRLIRVFVWAGLLAAAVVFWVLMAWWVARFVLV